MTEPDEALLWAREQAKQLREAPNNPTRDLSAEIDAGMHDDELSDMAHAYRIKGAMSAERIKELEARVAELEAALAKANEPRWFYSDEKGTAWWSLEEALEQVTDDIRDLYHAEDMPSNHLVEIETSRPCPTIWGVLQLLADDEAKARGCKEPWVFTPCATEAEARALLKETAA